MDDVEILLASGPGNPARSVAKAASGGELSRVMLAIEVVGRTAAVPTFVFDEVDAGVGGRAAIDVGARLATLAGQAQVVVVTHLAQVAAFADRHLVVRKSDDGVVTSSNVQVLEGDERLQELSRMMGGDATSAAGLEHARELLDQAAALRAAPRRGRSTGADRTPALSRNDRQSRMARWTAMSSSPVRPPVVPERTATALGAAVVAWGLLLAVVTFARWPALSWSVGATCLGTVYQAVNAVPTVLFDLAAGGALASVSVPMLVGALGHGRPRDVARLGSAVLTWTVVVLGACSVAVGLAAAPLAGVLVGESGCTGAVDVAADLLRWFAPQPVLLGAGVVLGGILRAHGRPPRGGGRAGAGLTGRRRQPRVVPPAGGGQRRHRRPGGTSGGARRGTTLAALVVAAVPAVLLWRTGVALRRAVRAPVALADEWWWPRPWCSPRSRWSSPRWRRLS